MFINVIIGKNSLLLYYKDDYEIRKFKANTSLRTSTKFSRCDRVANGPIFYP